MILIYLAECRDEDGGQQNCSKHIFTKNPGTPCEVYDCPNSSCHSISGCGKNPCMMLITFSSSVPKGWNVKNELLSEIE